MMALGQALPAGQPFLHSTPVILGTLPDAEGFLHFWKVMLSTVFQEK